MKAECLKDALQDGVQLAGRIVGKNLALPVLGGVLFSAQKNTITLRATNLDLGVEIQIPAKIENEGVTVIPGHILLGVLSALNDRKVVIDVSDNILSISTIHTKSTIQCLSSDDFPTLPTLSDTVESFSFPVQKFIDGVKSVWYSASVSDMKPEIASIYIYQNENTVIFAATDSFRLAEKKISVKNGAEFSPILIPYKNIIEILRVFESLSGDIEVKFNKNQISFSSEKIYVTSRIIDGIFPDYHQIIPKEYTTEAVLLKQDIINTLRITHLFSDKFNRVDFYINPEKKLFEVKAKHTPIGENTTQIEARLSGAEISCGFNQKYILDCFQAIKQESVIFSFSGVGRPLVIQGINDKSFTYLVMPLTT